MNVRDFRKVTGKRLGQAVFNAWLTKVPTLFTNNFKILFLRWLGASVGANVKIGSKVKVLGPGNLTIGDNVALAHSVVVDARGGLRLDDGALIGFESVLLTYTHASEDPDRPVHNQGTVQGPISIGANSWLGARCIVLPGTAIGESSIVGALSVVSRNIPPNTVAAGSPAVAIKPRSQGII